MPNFSAECVEAWLEFDKSHQHERGWEYEGCTLKMPMGDMPAGTKVPFVVVDHRDSMIYTIVDGPWCPMFPFRVVPGCQDTGPDEKIKGVAHMLLPADQQNDDLFSQARNILDATVDLARACTTTSSTSSSVDKQTTSESYSAYDAHAYCGPCYED